MKKRKYNKHGLTNHPLYRVIIEMRERCYNRKDPFYHNYGAKGIKVCQEWLDNPANFINWAIGKGWKKGLQIDKDIIPQKMGIPASIYSPDMCSVVTPIENNARKINSRLLTLNGVTKNLTEWGRYLNVDPTTILHRINSLKWSVEEALTNTHKKRKKINMQEAIKIRSKRKNGVSCKEIADEYGMDVSNVFLIVQNKTWKAK